MTLPLALSPVILGSASAWWAGAFEPPLAALALLLALALQVGVNFANDYSDGVRGTDDYRVGPARLTGSGLAEPHVVKRVAFLWFGIATVVGVVLVSLSGSWWLLVVGAFALLAAGTYTGGQSPYGYRGLGEVVVFVFFGLVATIGTAYVQVGAVPGETWLTGSALGFFASAVLLENNLRDIDQDRVAKKRTLAVVLRPTLARVAITAMLVMPYAIVGVLALAFIRAPAVFVTGILTAVIVVIIWSRTTAKVLIVALQLTTLNSLLYAIALGAVIAF